MTDVAPPSPSFRRSGRLVIYAVFILFAGYILTSVLTSVFLALYGNPPSTLDGGFSAEERSYCVRTLVGLRDELEQEVTNVAQPPRPRIDAKERWQTWDVSFHERFNSAQSRCTRDDRFDRAYESLGSMYDGYAIAAKRIIEVREGVAPQVADVVELLRDPNGAEP